MRRYFASSVLILGLAAQVAAQPPVQRRVPAPAAAPPAASAERFEATAVVAHVRRIIAETYVLPERRPALDAVLAEGLAAGRYRVSEPSVLAERINADLARVGRDRHLNFVHDPRQAEQLTAARRPSAPDNGGYERQVRQRNHGVAELKVLPGNVRYLDYRGFNWIGEESRVALDTAMQFLSGGDAVIIDLRRNGGGSPEAVQHIVSHFMEADRPLVTFYMNGEASPDRLATLRELRAPRMIGKPLYVLISGGTGSAAEEFAGHVAGYRLGELVGVNTAGAGFRNDLIAIPGGFVLSVSVGRAVLASTGRDWEAVGHAPTIPVPIENALEAAQAHALRRLAGSASPDARPQLELLAETMSARAERRAPALPLASYAGRYGERSVTVEGDKLYYQRGTGPREMLIALGDNRFAFDSNPGVRVDFQVAASRAVAIQLGGSAVAGTFERTP